MIAPISSRGWVRAIRAGAVAAAGAVLLSSCGSLYDVDLPGGTKVDDPITVHAKFRDVLDLVPQSTVKVDDVTVGRVTQVKLEGYTADVTLVLPKGIDLPDNARAEIRQTSLLGEKFVSLSAPADAATDKLGNGDVIPLSRTGRNPEVEEVLGALSLLLNGGGVGQLKLIATELNKAFGGREDEVRSVLDQLRTFTGQLDANKVQIVRAIDSLDRLARQLKDQDGAIKLALDDLPAAVKSINSQRADLVKTLQALQKLSGVGVRVIQASKEGTINTLRDLAPVLEKLAEAGSNFPKSLQIALTYPFVDAAVGNDPQVARNLHLGDFVNLDVRLDVKLDKIPTLPSIPVPSEICNTTEALKKQFIAAARQVVAALPDVPFKDLKDRILSRVIDAIEALKCDDPLNQQVFEQIVADVIRDLYSGLTPQQIQDLLDGVVGGLGGVLGGGTGGSGGGLGLPLGLGRTGTSYAAGDSVLNGPAGTASQLGYNSTLGALLLQGVDAK